MIFRSRLSKNLFEIGLGVVFLLDISVGVGLFIGVCRVWGEGGNLIRGRWE